MSGMRRITDLARLRPAIIFIGLVALSTGTLILLDHISPAWLGVLLVSFQTLCFVGVVALYAGITIVQWRRVRGK
jgi:hypothetical protein